MKRESQPFQVKMICNFGAFVFSYVFVFSRVFVFSEKRQSSQVNMASQWVCDLMMSIFVIFVLLQQRRSSQVKMATQWVCELYERFFCQRRYSQAKVARQLHWELLKRFLCCFGFRLLCSSVCAPITYPSADLCLQEGLMEIPL